MRRSVVVAITGTLAIAVATAAIAVCVFLPVRSQSNALADVFANPNIPMEEREQLFKVVAKTAMGAHPRSEERGDPPTL